MTGELLKALQLKSAQTIDEQIERQLIESYGLRNLKRAWISAQRTSRQNSLVRSICDTEIREISNGSLPWRIHDAHGVRLGAKVLVQIDKITNVGAPDPKAPFPRLLQYALSDGETSLIGIELDTSKSSFSPNTAPGTKLTLLPTALLRRGRVFLTFEDYELVGVPQGRARTSASGPAIQVPPGHTGTEQFSCCNVGRAFGDPSTRTLATNIINVGGIAAMTEESDDVGDADGLWSWNPTVRIRYPPALRQRVAGHSPMGSRIKEEPKVSALQSPIEPNLPPHSIDVGGSREDARDGKQRWNRSMVVGCGSGATKKKAILADQQSYSVCIVNTVPMDVDIDLTAAQPIQQVNGMPSSSDAIEVSNPERAEQALEPERIGTADRDSPQLARLKDLSESPHLLTSRPQFCRLYATRIGKKASHHLTRTPTAYAVVDDGTAVRIVSVLDEILDNLRISSSPRSVSVLHRANRDIRRFLRSILGLVKLEFRDNTLAATAHVSEPATVSSQSPCVS